MKKQLNIGAYIRVSTDRQVQVFEGSLDTQKYRMLEFVNARNRDQKSWGEIVEFYVDEGLSAGTDRRPQYQKMMADVRSGKINLILVADISRLSRSVHDFSVLLRELENHNASYLSMKEQFDTTTPAGRLMINMVVNMAQFEREQTSERVAINCNSRAMRGFVNGARPVLGFSRHPDKSGVLVINDMDAKKIRKIFEIFLEEGTIGKTLPIIESLKILPRSSKNVERVSISPRWNYSAVRDILTNPAYVGLKEVNKKNKGADPETLKPWQHYQVVKASWDGIIEKAVFDQVQEVLQQNALLERRKMEEAERRVFLLSGILRCGECGRTLSGQSAHGEKAVHRYYSHSYKRGSESSCSLKRIRADEIEDVVISYLTNVVSRAGYMSGIEENLKSAVNMTPASYSEQIGNVKNALSEVEIEIKATFKLQMKTSLGDEAASLAVQHLEELGQKKKQLGTLLAKLKDQEGTVVDTDSVMNAIKNRVADFKKGFPKANAFLKRRLLRKVLKELILTDRGLETSFNVDIGNPNQTEDDSLSYEYGKLLSFKRKVMNNDSSPSVPLRATGPDFTPSFELLLNDGNGWGSRTRTCE
ncbi:recombinase family protein [Bdellovibrio sp. ZAP7]|uniref:recombinase family protein n=1 Tax=Bdellovibrio sp. ZAP7 TaxID=2231053 RepID=UPI00143D8730|nr:recombinase family protein [Bdellovibrio sp. ZAP7]